MTGLASILTRRTTLSGGLGAAGVTLLALPRADAATVPDDADAALLELTSKVMRRWKA